MAELTLKLDGEALGKATAQAIAGILTPEMKAELLAKAIEQILKPPGYNEKSPIEQAFVIAAEKIAREEVIRMCSEDCDFRLKVQLLMRTTAEKMIGMDVDKLADRMASAMVDSLRKGY